MPPKETVLDLARFIDKGVQVKLSGGREVTGTLKGFDQLLNLVLDGAVEHLRDFEDALKITEETRELGLLVCRGTSVMVVSALDSMEEIANPFLAQEEIDFETDRRILEYDATTSQRGGANAGGGDSRDAMRWF